MQLPLHYVTNKLVLVLVFINDSAISNEEVFLSLDVHGIAVLEEFLENFTFVLIFLYLVVLVKEHEVIAAEAGRKFELFFYVSLLHLGDFGPRHLKPDGVVLVKLSDITDNVAIFR